jgi:uncharacterized protein YciI
MELVLLFLAALPGFAATAQSAESQQAARKPYIYLLRLDPKFLTESNWTEADQAAVQAHFVRLVRMTEDGTLAHAGRSISDTPIGVVILEAASDEEAKRIAETDPAVVKGVMTAEVFPYEVLLARTSESAL